MSTGPYYSGEEKTFILEEFYKKGKLTKEDFEAMSNVWPGIFKVDRNINGLSACAIRLVKAKAIKEEKPFDRGSIWVQQYKNKKPSSPKGKTSETPGSAWNGIKVSSERLRSLLCRAKEIKRMADSLCADVVLFSEEYEKDRELMKGLTKIRQAVEDFQKKP